MTGQLSLMAKEEEEEDEGNDFSDSDRKSKMSFSYWGADKVTIHKPVVKPRQTSNSSRKGALSPLGYGRESSANAKFGTRLLNPDFSYSHPRPASRRTQATPTSVIAPFHKIICKDGNKTHQNPRTPKIHNKQPDKQTRGKKYRMCADQE